MKIFKKILIYLFIIFISLVFISCSFKDDNVQEQIPNDNENNQINEEEPNTEDPKQDPSEENPSESLVDFHFNFDNKNIIASDAFKSFDLTYDKNGYIKYQNKVLDCINNKKGIQALNEAYDEFTNYYSDINDKSAILEVLYYANRKEVGNACTDLYEYSLLIDTTISKLDQAIAKSEYAKDFFTGYTDEEIEALANTDVDDELNKLLLKKKELNNNYVDAKTIDEKERILKEYVLNNKKIAIAQGYEENEYVKYSDSFDYVRLYDEEVVDSFISNVKEQLMDLIFDMYDLDLSPENNAQYKQFMKYQNGAFLEQQALFDDFVNTVGGTFKEAYNNLFDGGYYLFSNDPNVQATAFQNNTDNINLVFFGGEYRDLSTFAHEFGHYHATYLHNDQYSYDFCETQSQASEILLRLYLSEKYDNEATLNYEMNLVYELLCTILDGIMIREYEEMIYTQNVESFQELWLTLNDEEYDDWGYDDWFDIFIDYDNYYISYATSALASLIVYAYGKENGFEEASKLYLDLVSYDGYGDISEAFKSVNLVDPLSAEATVYIKEVIEKVINDYVQ